MRRFMVLCTSVLAFSMLAFTLSEALAAHVVVTLTKDQVHNMCGGQDYCQKSCGSEKQYTCEYGCGTKSCGGGCLTCPQGASRQIRRGIVLGNTTLQGGQLSRVQHQDLSVTKKTDASSSKLMMETTTAPRDASTGQATGKRMYKPIR